jgi:hypothetical protein
MRCTAKIKNMKCPKCNNELIWGGDDDYEDFLIEDKEGIVSNNTCPNDECDVDMVIIYTELKQ